MAIIREEHRNGDTIQVGLDDHLMLGAIVIAAFVGMILYAVCFVMGMKGKFDLQKNEEGKTEAKLKCGCC